MTGSQIFKKNRKGVDRWKKNQRVRWALLNDGWHMMKEKQMIRWERSLAKPRPVRQYVTVISCSRKRGTQGLWFVSLPSCPVRATKNSLSNKSHPIFQALRCNEQGRGTSLALVEMLHLWYTLARRHGKYWTTVEFRQHPVGWKKKNGSHKDAARLLFVDGKCLENSESVRFQYKPLSLSLSFLWMRPGFLSHPTPALILEHRCWP